MDIGLQASLYYYRLGLIKREDNLYSLVDLETNEWFEKMTIYYIKKLLNSWNQHQRYQQNKVIGI